MDRDEKLVLFCKDLEAFKIDLTTHQIKQFVKYYELLAQWNERINLTAITEFREVCQKHFVDSLSLVKLHDAIKGEQGIIVGNEMGEGEDAQYKDFRSTIVNILDKMTDTKDKLGGMPDRRGMERFEEAGVKDVRDSNRAALPERRVRNVSVIDVGTGAGFPGIPLKIAFPNIELTLVESSGKRVEFLSEVIKELAIGNCKVIHARAEDMGGDGENLREKFDVCVSRAVSNLSTLSEYCLPYVRQGGFFLAYKSANIAEEVEEATNAIELLGGKLGRQVEFCLPNSDIHRNIVIIRKVAETPEKYPRRAGLPKKKPL